MKVSVVEQAKILFTKVVFASGHSCLRKQLSFPGYTSIKLVEIAYSLSFQPDHSCSVLFLHTFSNPWQTALIFVKKSFKQNTKVHIPYGVQLPVYQE